MATVKLAARLWSAVRIAAKPKLIVDGASNRSQSPQVSQLSAFVKLSCSACMKGKVKAPPRKSRWRGFLVVSLTAIPRRMHRISSDFRS